MISKRTRVGILYFIVIISTLLLRISTYLGIADNLLIDSSEYFTLIVQLVIFGFIPLVGYCLFIISTKENIITFREDFGIKKVSGKNWLRIFIIVILMMIVSYGLSYVWQMVLALMGFTRVQSSTDYSSIGILFKELLMVALLPGIFEEVAHRGLIYAGYKKCGWKFVLVSALLFSLMHQNIVQTGYTFFDGCIIALTMFYTGSIWPGIFMHIFNNALSVLNEYISQNGGVFNFINVIRSWLSTTTGGFIVSVFCIILASVLLFFMFSRLRRDAAKKGIVDDNRIFENKTIGTIKPLHKDVFFILCILIGIAATTFSLVWGLMR